MKNIIKTLSKKITCLLLLVVIVVLTFSGCSAQNKAQAAVDSEIASVTADESYMKLSDEEKAEKVEAKLDQLVKDGKVKENSVNFDEQNKIISFQYSDETLGAVSIKNARKINIMVLHILQIKILRLSNSTYSVILQILKHRQV